MRLFLTCLIALLPAQALAWPNGPEEDPRLDKPNDPGFGGQWNLWSHVPDSWLPNITPESERNLGPASTPTAPGRSRPATAA